MNILKKICLLSLVILIYCDNPFKIRDPEPPTEDRSSWIQPTSPLVVLTNLKNAIQEANTPNYMKCLTDSVGRFEFIPDEYVRQNNLGIFDNWTLNHERNYITNLINASTDSTKKVSFTNVQVDFQDSVLIKLDYDIEIHHNLSASYPDHVEGQVNFWLQSSNGEYYITQWQDFGTADNKPSWSSIKASFGK